MRTSSARASCRWAPGWPAGSIEKVRAVREAAAGSSRFGSTPRSRCSLRVTLRQDGGRVGPHRKAKVAVGNDRIRLPIAGAARRGKSRVTTELTDGGGDSVTERFRLRLPAPR